MRWRSHVPKLTNISSCKHYAKTVPPVEYLPSQLNQYRLHGILSFPLHKAGQHLWIDNAVG